MGMNGKHIKAQVYGVELWRLVNLELTSNLLTSLVESAGMMPLDKPAVYDIKSSLEKQGLQVDPDEPEGVTGVVVLSTSHVAVHTWPHRKYAVIDVYSCRDFKTGAVYDTLEECYSPKVCKVFDCSYALEMPDVVEQEDTDV